MVIAIILIVLVAVVVILAVGGAVAAKRRQVADESARNQQIQQANRQLADAHAEDRGWDLAVMEAAAREAAGAQLGAAEVTELHLVQVVDRPGTDSDEAVFAVRTSEGAHHVKLGRRDGAWVAAR